jgi:mono/diheme cytochrome c family protein
MIKRRRSQLPVLLVAVLAVVAAMVTATALAQLPDKTRTPNVAGEGINKSFTEQIGAGRGSISTPGSSLFIINRDPFRAIRRGRQVFQRKFVRSQGQGPLFQDGLGNINEDLALGAGLADSCAACHGRPRGSAGAGGDVVTRPDSRDAPHLFGLGLKEMLADEITTDLRAIRADAINDARATCRDQIRDLNSKGINYGKIIADVDSSCRVRVITSQVDGVNADLRVRPFFLQGGTISMREFLVGAFQAEMGLQPVDPDLARAQSGQRVVTPSGMVLDGRIDDIEVAFEQDATTDGDGDAVLNEIPTSIVDFMEFYLLNYFKAGTYRQTSSVSTGRSIFMQIGCAQCHIPDLQIERDRRVADVETVFDIERGIFNDLFSTATPLFNETDDPGSFPTLKRAALKPFLVKNIFTDFKRHDLGPNFWERNFNGTFQKEFLTAALWGVGTTAPYGHDGRSVNLREVIKRHGGEAMTARNNFVNLSDANEDHVLNFLNSLILFPPDDTASNLDPGDPNAPNFPQIGKGSIRLTTLFNNPNDPE